MTTQYVYKITSSNNPDMPRGTVYLTQDDDGARHVAEWVHDGNFSVQFRAKRVGVIRWKTLAGKRRQFDALFKKAA